ncbi:MAG: hypothetical protein IKA98_04725, partial [Candidatus Methanomethylophilaceae archaeon]|nr:hypothetical protein [Candidatus Methanomethylophilaceae archaeon]
ECGREDAYESIIKTILRIVTDQVETPFIRIHQPEISFKGIGDFVDIEDLKNTILGVEDVM